jgi:hypothetical protein
MYDTFGGWIFFFFTSKPYSSRGMVGRFCLRAYTLCYSRFFWHTLFGFALKNGEGSDDEVATGVERCVCFFAWEHDDEG